jgi:MraZ protein
MEGLDPFDSEVVDFVHAVLAVTEEVDVDKAGRIRLPPELRDLAGIGKDVRVFSVLDRIEIWDAARWEERFAQARERSPSLGGLPRKEVA